MGGLFQGTVAAMATPAGRGALAVVRMSGPEAVDILLRVCPALRGSPPPPREQRLLPIVHPENGDQLDRALVSLFRAPASYTGEDTVELSTHGGTLTPQLVLDALYSAGARPAEPGEFTRRAMLNGKLDLLQAEAVLDLIDGRSPALHRVAVHQMERGLSTRVEALRREILRVQGMVAYAIDFPDEDEPPVPPERIDGAAAGVMESIDALVRTAPQGELLREGALVVLAGRPNSGKSSLFNALLGLERAIVTEIAGTTRDALEADLTLEGYPFRLVDTAGLRSTGDRVERIGIEVAQRYLKAAELVLFCAPVGAPLSAEELGFLAEVDAERVVVVRTMADVTPGAHAGAPGGSQDGRDVAARAPDGEGAVAEVLRTAVIVSALTGAGLDTLRHTVAAKIFSGIASAGEEAPLITRRRHERALRRSLDELGLFREAMGGGVPMEFAATHLGVAVGSLEDLIGVVTPDEVLGEVFSAFCVGK